MINDYQNHQVSFYIQLKFNDTEHIYIYDQYHTMIYKVSLSQCLCGYCLCIWWKSYYQRVAVMNSWAHHEHDHTYVCCLNPIDIPEQNLY